MKKLLLLILIHGNSHALEQSKTIELDNISTKGLDKNVSKVFKKTRQLIQQARKEKDENTEMSASKQWCLLLHNFNFLKQATECYYSIGIADKNNPKWPYLYGKASAELGEFDQAKIGFNETIRRDANYLPAYYYAIQIELNDDHLLAAFTQFSESPSHLQLLSPMLNLAGDLYYAVENYHVAIGFYKQALLRVPQAKSLNYKIAKSYQALNLMQQAESYIGQSDATKIRIIDPHYQEVKSTTVGEIPYLIKAKKALANGDPKSAIKSYKKALKYNPKSESATINIAVAYFQLEQINTAKEYFNKALLINPKNTKILYNLATISLIEGNSEAAFKYFQSFHQLDNTDTVVNYQLATFYYQLQQYQKVIDIANMEPMRTHVDAQYLKAKAFIQTQHYSDAIALLTTINENSPDNHKVLMALTKILSQVPDANLRNPQLSVEYAQQALKLKANPQIYWLLIIALDQNNQCDSLRNNMQILSQLLNVSVNQGYQKLTVERGRDLKCYES